jgi:poly-gamma-glutamate capsule biosynthesis protein CapA/YwtB (metallophosphatase superfamily)
MEDKHSQPRPITIGLAGDVMIGRLVNENMKEVPSNYIWGNILPLLHSTDFNLINLEAALTTNDEVVPKVFNFKSDPKNVQALLDGRIDMVNLANNHVLDYAVKGLLETLDTLDNASMPHVGAGKTWEEAVRPAIVERKGIKIGVLGATDNEAGWKARADKPGTFYIKIGDIQPLEEPIKKLRSQVDLLIVTLHWGPNMVERPPTEFREFAHKLLDRGADLIHGHSAHIYQGVEIYKGNKVIFYDTGDFVDDYAIDPILRNDLSFFFTVDATGKGIESIRLIPVRIHNFQVNRVEKEKAAPILKRMQQLSKEFGTTLQIEEGCLTLRLKP